MPDARNTHDTELPNLQLQVFLNSTAHRQHGKHRGEHAGRAAIMIIDAAGQTQKVVDADNFAAQVPYADAEGKTRETWRWPLRS
jgi:hypothetical protein